MTLGSNYFVMRIPRLALVLLLAPLAAQAQNVAITVDASQTVRTVDERVFGANSVIWDPQAASTQTISLLQAAGLRTVRVPGGSLSDEYHWAKNTTLANTWTWASHFGSFARLLTGLNAQAFVTVNYGTGTPQEAAALVAYLNRPVADVSTNPVIGVDAKGTDWKAADFWAGVRAGSPLATDDGFNFLRIARTAAVGAKYWEIGNENYGSWETDEQEVRHDPFTYANRAKDYIARMKAIDPTIKVGVVVETGEDDYANNTNHPATNPRTNQVHNGWTPVLLTTLRQIGVTPDFVTYHRYDQAPGQESDSFLLQSAATWKNDAADLRQQVNDYLGAAGANVEIVVTENNSVYTDPGKQSTSVVNGLFLADSVANIMQTEINALVWWDVRNGTPTNSSGQIIGNQSASLYGWRNYGDYGMISSPTTGAATTYFELYPTYYAMKLLSYFARGGDTVVKTTSGSNLLAAYATKRSDGTLALLVLNKHATQTQTGSFTLTGFTPANSANVYSYGITQDNAAKPGGSGLTDIASTTMNIAGATFTATFTPYSMTVIVLSTGTGGPTPPTPPTPNPPTPPSPPPTPTPPAGGGGGGGAPSAWFLAALAALAAIRGMRSIP
jgi:alpha-N-arabinofuranosidase